MKLEHYYVNEYHSELPHIVKFSGGRSSGALLFSMLKNNMLKASRGDVIIFNNTSAEHSKTYTFVMECKKRCEEEFNIPFFLTEFQTFEDSKKGIYDRFQSYRLVNENPYSKNNPNGYHHKGEVFEELISWQMYLPSLMSGRTCTKKMKMDVTYEFLNDWLTNGDSIPRLGHYGTTSRVDKSILYAKHKKSGGEVPEHIYQKKKEYCLTRNLYRPRQNFEDYTSVPIAKDAIYIPGKNIEFCSFIGFRADEPMRLTKMKNRIDSKENENIKVAYLRENNEHIYTPMIQFNITQEDVKNHWDNQGWDLDLPYDGSLGNCVYCFMKGGNKLSNIASNSKDMTPENIDWWINIEKKYQRDLVAEKRTIRTETKNPFINFFGVNGKISYEIIKNGENQEVIDTSLPCHCTD